MTRQALDKNLYAKAGVSGFDPRSPLAVTEKHFTHRASQDIECHDCGNLISKGEPMIVSSLECIQGLKGKTHRYEIHLPCYDVVGQVVAILGKQATHGLEGRPSLMKLWAEHHAAIQRSDKAVAAQLERGFGKP